MGKRCVYRHVEVYDEPTPLVAVQPDLRVMRCNRWGSRGRVQVRQALAGTKAFPCKPANRDPTCLVTSRSSRSVMKGLSLGVERRAVMTLRMNSSGSGRHASSCCSACKNGVA